MNHTTSHDHVQPTDVGEGPHPRPTSSAWLLTVDEAAAQLSLSRSMIYTLMNSGELRSIRFGTTRRIPQAALYELVEQKMRSSQALIAAEAAEQDAMTYGSDRWSLPEARRKTNRESGGAA